MNFPFIRIHVALLYSYALAKRTKCIFFVLDVSFTMRRIPRVPVYENETSTLDILLRSISRVGKLPLNENFRVDGSRLTTLNPCAKSCGCKRIAFCITILPFVLIQVFWLLFLSFPSTRRIVFYLLAFSLFPLHFFVMSIFLSFIVIRKA